MRVPTTTTVAPNDSRRRHHRQRPRRPSHSHKNWTSCRGTPNAYGTLAFGTPTSPFGYSGQHTDATTSFVNDRARFYSPGPGSFTTRDPAFTSTDTAYTYAGSDPVNSADPSGQWNSSACAGDATSPLLGEVSDGLGGCGRQLALLNGSAGAQCMQDINDCSMSLYDPCSATYGSWNCLVMCRRP